MRRLTWLVASLIVTAVPACGKSESAPVAETKPAKAVPKGPSWGPDVVELPAHNCKSCEAELWAFFDYYAKPRSDAAMDALKKDKPATWKQDESDVRQRIKTERDAQQTKAKALTFGHSFEMDLPEYDSKTESFPVKSPAVIGLGVGGWHIAFGKRPRVPESFNDVFSGGEPQAWPIKVPMANADDFVKNNTAAGWDRSIRAEVLFKVFDYVSAPQHFVVVGKVQSWKLLNKKTGVVLASGP